MTSLKNFIKTIKSNLSKKYEKVFSRFDSNLIDNIIYNERAHIVAKFKDRLISDDYGEFLKRYYKYDESYIRLPKFIEYYELYSKIFPNYTSLPEAKFFYQNIQCKQKMIDAQEEIEIEKQKKLNDANTEINGENNSEVETILDDDIFSSKIIYSIFNQSCREEVELLFNVNKDNLPKDEGDFCEKINNIITIIKECEEKKSYKKLKNSNIIYKHNDKQNEYKKKIKSNSGKKEKTNLKNDYKFIKLNFLNKPIFKKNNIYKKSQMKKVNNSLNLKNKSINKFKTNDKNFIKIMEHNLFDKRQLISKHRSQNGFNNKSFNISIRKEISKSKRTSSNSKQKKSSLHNSSMNMINNMNVSFSKKNKNYSKIFPLAQNNKRIKFLNPLTCRMFRKDDFNFSVEKKKTSKAKKICSKYNNYSMNNIRAEKTKRNKRNSSDKSMKKEKSKSYKNYPKSNMNKTKKGSNHNNSNYKLQKKKHSNSATIINSKITDKKKINYQIDSRNCVINDFMNSKKYPKTNSTKRKNSADSNSYSRYNLSKSRSRSNKKNKNHNSRLDNIKINIVLKKNKIMNCRNIGPIKNAKNHTTKFNWRIDSRNRHTLYLKNTSKNKSKNIFYQYDSSSLKSSFLGAINYTKKITKYKNMRKDSKIFKILNKDYCSRTQKNRSFINYLY